jgi:hypothetical protein
MCYTVLCTTQLEGYHHTPPEGTPIPPVDLGTGLKLKPLSVNRISIVPVSGLQTTF